MSAVIVVGAGPAGRALAHRLTHTGISVTVIDPAPDRVWTATYGAWTDELPEWLADDATAARTTTIAAYGRHRHSIDRGYTVLDTAALHRSLSLADVEVVRGRVVDIGATSVQLADGGQHIAGSIIDCRGLRNPAAARQTAFGIVVGAVDAAPVLDSAEAVLMDWRGNAARPTPSFLYAVPVGNDEVLLEETCLAGRPALGLDELRRRLRDRLGGLGIGDPSVRRIERVSFALTPHHPPWRVRQPIGFGAAGGLIHPATGYSVGTALAATDTMVRAIVGGKASADTLWSPTARATYLLRTRGLSALLSLPGAQTVDFFDAFLGLPPRVQRGYLSGHGELTGTLRAMAWVFACLDGPTRRHLLTVVGRG